MYGPPSDCKQNLCRGWFGLRKCIRPVCGAKLLALMESARRWSIFRPRIAFWRGTGYTCAVVTLHASSIGQATRSRSWNREWQFPALTVHPATALPQEISHWFPVRSLPIPRSCRNSFVLMRHSSSEGGVVAPIGMMDQCRISARATSRSGNRPRTMK